MSIYDTLRDGYSLDKNPSSVEVGVNSALVFDKPMIRKVGSDQMLCPECQGVGLVRTETHIVSCGKCHGQCVVFKCEFCGSPSYGPSHYNCSCEKAKEKRAELSSIERKESSNSRLAQELSRGVPSSEYTGKYVFADESTIVDPEEHLANILGDEDDGSEEFYQNSPNKDELPEYVTAPEAIPMEVEDLLKSIRRVDWETISEVFGFDELMGESADNVRGTDELVSKIHQVMEEFAKTNVAGTFYQEGNREVILLERGDFAYAPIEEVSELTDGSTRIGKTFRSVGHAAAAYNTSPDDIRARIENPPEGSFKLRFASK